MKEPSEKAPNQPQLKKGLELFYRFLAVGKYASDWLPELLTLMEITLDEGDDAKTDIWLFNQMAKAIGPSIYGRLLRVVYAVWRVFILIWRS